MTETDRGYLQRRMEQELLRAAKTDVPEAALAHRRLAEGYETRLEKAERMSRPKLRIV